MPDLTITWTLTDQEFALLTRQVAAEGKGERPEAYVARVGLKGIRGQLENGVAVARQNAIDVLTKAFDAAEPEAKAKALEPLGYVLSGDGSVIPK